MFFNNSEKYINLVREDNDMKNILCWSIFGIVFLVLSVSAIGGEIPNGFYLYKIKKGDLLGNLALPRNWDEIMRINRVDSRHLRIGEMILLPVNPNRIPYFCPVPKNIKTAKKISQTIYIFLDIQYFGAYKYGKLLFWGPISSGKGGIHQTPTGLFYIRWKAKKYFSHSQECYGAPMPYALNLSNTGYFLHEQVMPGKPASHGCIRLLRIDAKKLFFWSKISDLVAIVK